MNFTDRICGISSITGRPLHLCPNCSAYVAATLAEQLEGAGIRNMWHCEVCGYKFETSVHLASKQSEQQTAY